MASKFFIYLPYIALIVVVMPRMVENFDTQTVTNVGKVWGNKKYVPELNKYIDVYLGVQFGVAPIGHLRYKAPQPLPKNKDTSLGREIFAPSCAQTNLEIFQDFEGAADWKTPPSISEDCLYLNIWKPQNADATHRKPVIVWIHGGGFNYGSSSVPAYDGKYLAAWTDALVVSIQYRLGALGFLYTGDDFAPGNAGLKDQALALRWIHDNVEFFGGDKEKITIVGESAGGASVGFHLLSKETSKLFKRAILLSGVPNSGWAVLRPGESWHLTLEFAKKLGAQTDNYTDVMRHLSNRKWEEIIDAQGGKIEFKALFVPTIEPSMVPEHPLRLLQKADHLKGKEMIVSWTKDEGSLFVMFDMFKHKKMIKAVDIPTIYLDDFMRFIDDFAGHDEDVKKQLLKSYNGTGEKPYLKGLVKFHGDYQMVCPINQFILESRNRGAIVYHGEYNYRHQNIPWPEWIGAHHGIDVYMLFGIPIYRKNFTETDKRVCKVYMDRIKDFVFRGSPNEPNEPSWFDNHMFVISDTIKENDNRTNACAKLKKLMPRYLSSGSRNHLDVLGFLALFLAFLRILH